PTRSRACPRRPAALAARTPETHPPRPTHGSADTPTSNYRSRSRRARSTASPYAARAGSRSSRPGPEHAADDSPRDATAAPAEAAPSAPTPAPGSANRRLQPRDPSHPPSPISATRSDFATPVRVPAYRNDLLVE